MKKIISSITLAILLSGMISFSSQSQLTLASNDNFSKSQFVTEQSKLKKKQTSEQREKGKQIDEQLSSVMPYVSLNEDNIVTVDIVAAKAAKVPKSSIQTAEKYFQEQNRMITEIASGKTMAEVEFSDDFEGSFNDYFYYLAEGKNAPPVVQNTNFGVIQPDANGGCGGDTDNPHPCPPRQTLYWFYSLPELQTIFLNQGYHATAHYAGGSADWNPARDYTKCVSAYNCGSCAFRYQAVFADTNTANKYHAIVQVPEPNPEILSYIWPTGSWGLYVKWWHDYSC
ncbi:hypothetical protein CIG75_17540 [Tumebacillus algifaecis]|uniref:Uncharacterized protein n=1 Tax=Tumebacillus algifaecis TaxID=1214604 RepID=A0A223D4N6_9BACL|nr:hypothetical protein [Tumebacillus algifaecis]ASS76588.1 hypothetical protein CIG75_17540 [Tumebacillus algifaecis]